MKWIAASIAAIPCLLGLYVLLADTSDPNNRPVPLIAYKHPVDMLLAAAPNWIVRRYHLAAPCEQRDIDTCVAMTGPQTFSGVWIDYLNGANFFPGEIEMPTAGCTPPAGLRFPNGKDEDTYRARNRAGRRFSSGGMIRFVGRKTKYSGHYFGGREGVYVIDKILAYRPLGGFYQFVCPLG